VELHDGRLLDHAQQQLGGDVILICEPGARYRSALLLRETIIDGGVTGEPLLLAVIFHSVPADLRAKRHPPTALAAV